MGQPLNLYKHQTDAIKTASRGSNFVLTTGTGSGKSLAYIIPIVDHVLHYGSGKGIKAIIVYPMNALVNSQYLELEKFICYGYPDDKRPVTFEKYTGQEDEDKRKYIIDNPPDILITNYVMLELILTRIRDRELLKAAHSLRFLVFDELHTYRGRQGADVAMLIRRLKDYCSDDDLQYIGTSATMITGGSFREQQAEVARIASLIFGTTVAPDCVIGEALRRTTPNRNLADEKFVADLKQSVLSCDSASFIGFQEFVEDPLSVWIENTFGIRQDELEQRWVRCYPIPITGNEGAAGKLSSLTGVPVEQCVLAIQNRLMAGHDPHYKNPLNGFPAFAFRLHAFFSRGDTVFASLDEGERRYITIEGQEFVPGKRDRVLMPLAFCRECGQEYYTVYGRREKNSNDIHFEQRDLTDREANEDDLVGFLYRNKDDPWPENDAEALMQRIPDDWLEIGPMGIRIKKSQMKNLPRTVWITSDGKIATGNDPAALDFQFVRAPFRFCLNCGVTYIGGRHSDMTALATLGSGGRSTAITIFSKTVIQALREGTTKLASRDARKLLSFTDNRQDAALQSGHFNDFIQVGLIRIAIYKAIEAAGSGGLGHDEIVQEVFKHLDLPFEEYAFNPLVRFQAKKDTEQALRNILGYRLYQDLRRGWRIVFPNLEQCGLLEIKYPVLEELCACGDEDIWVKQRWGSAWMDCHPALVTASPETRARVTGALLDTMRRSLAIKVMYLNREFQERIHHQSSQLLKEPWNIDDEEVKNLARAAILFPRPKKPTDYKGNFHLSQYSWFGRFLRRLSTFSEYGERINLDETLLIIRQLLRALHIAGLVEIVDESEGDECPGYLLNANSMRWVCGDGTRAYHDLIRVPRLPKGGGRTNPYFTELYQTAGNKLKGLKAREHTAQVLDEIRQDREAAFRSGDLPILYCSPTMELGVDIAKLNVVNMRNIPPTPANYAQRSGRAGREGQPALVFSYCATGSPHDQYYFKRQTMMVHGAVMPPRIDLTNEDLLESHIQAIWLEESGLGLGRSLKELLDTNGERPTLDLLPHVEATLKDNGIRQRAFRRAVSIFNVMKQQLGDDLEFDEERIIRVLNSLPQTFERACERWRNLYLAALQQQVLNNRIITDATRPAADKKHAQRLRGEAEAQLRLLTEESSNFTDFYSYRYFASEGFLPGYNFPRLPLSAYIPGRRRRGDRDEYISRPRFLAISEFGPRSFLYHEGSHYEISRVIIPATGRDDNLITTSTAKICAACGYLHPVRDGFNPDLCEYCGTVLPAAMTQLFKMENVVTRRRERINCDEEERVRKGYDLKTVMCFSRRNHEPSSKEASVEIDGAPLFKLVYGRSANIWRINVGWKRRREDKPIGFVLDIERGIWGKESDMVKPEEEDPDERMSSRSMRVVPFVEDYKNCLLISPEQTLDISEMASLQSALKHAIQAYYQLEEGELAAEPLPERDERRKLLFYEAAEGGAGVLRRLVEDPDALGNVARTALDICHFDPETGRDLRKTRGMREECEAACYNCLLSYANQLDHKLLDRQKIKDLLLRMVSATVIASPTAQPREKHLDKLLRTAGSELERKWLHFIDAHSCTLPEQAQCLIESCHTRPDFLYNEEKVAIYIDGPPHDYPERQQRDQQQTECLQDLGYTVLRFHHEDDWQEIIEYNAYLFGGNV